ncbi:hypothetical protein M8C21_023839 [Ambrosia artemisiifolia]|uniref:C3H1-type domain-containing protein n=1 Tax=Ambrosia artemisiifolia TaxID=4212 RepID=A0AAD5CIQ9_AMBAR|nr:hypothetical protein M8C21_023839 [Ambrosia artemisiifolia]
MSGRRRRSETIWDDKEEKRISAEIHSNISPGRSGYWSKSEAHDDVMHRNFSRSPSRNRLQGNRNGPRDDDIRRDRNRMYSHQTPDGWERQYSTHPSDDSYDLPYRSRDKGVGGNVRMSRERERTRSPHRSRSRSRSRDFVSRSRENTRGPRRESDASYPNMRNDSKDFASRGGGNNMTESWNRRTDYKDGSRHNDYRNTRTPCKFFAAGNCNRDYCKFSHDVPEAARGYNDDRNIGNRNRAWHDDQQPHDDRNAESNLGKMEKKKSWNSSVWNDVESGGFQDDMKSHPNVDNKRSSWNGPTSWDDVSGTSRQDHTSDDNNNNTWDSRGDKKKLFDGHASRDASGFHDAKSRRNLDKKRSSWNDPTSWDDASGSGFSNVSNTSNKYEESAKESLNDNNVKGGMSAKYGSNVDRNRTKKWDGPLWDELGEPVVVQTDNNIRKWDAPGSSKVASHNAEIVVNNRDLNSVVPEDFNQQVLTSGNDLIQNVHDMNTQSHSYLNGSEQRQMLLSNPYNGPLNGQGQGQGMYVHTENQNKEGGNPVKPLEMDVSQPRAANVVNDTSLTSQLAPQANTLPVEIPHIGRLPQLYPESNLASAIDYLKSLPNSAYNQDTKAKEEQDSVTNMEVKPSVPMGTLSGSVTQQNQTPADPVRESSKLSEIGVMKKEAVDATDKRVAENDKKEEESAKADNAADAHGKVEEGDTGNDEKAMRLFKVGLVEFVKEILKPKWKEGKMSRDVHKTVVKKVVEKVTSSIQGTQIPRTQPKIDQYLAYSKPKITKLAEAYMEKLLKS